MALPWYVFGFSLVYNKDILAQAGYDGPPATFDEFEEQIAAIAALDGDIIGLGADFSNGAGAGQQLYRWIWAYGGDVFDGEGNVVFDSPEAVAALAALADLQASNGDALTVGINTYAAREVFANEQVAFLGEAAWIRSILRDLSGQGEAFDDSWGVAPWPSGVDGTSIPSVSSHVWAIFKQSDHPEESMAFIDFLVSNAEHQETWPKCSDRHPCSRIKWASPYSTTPTTRHSSPRLRTAGRCPCIPRSPWWRRLSRRRSKKPWREGIPKKHWPEPPIPAGASSASNGSHRVLREYDEP